MLRILYVLIAIGLLTVLLHANARTINEIVVHTTDGHYTMEELDAYHKSRGWDGIGYHFVVDEEGTIHKGRDVEKVGAHVKDHNENSIGIAWIGTDTPTEEQYNALVASVLSLMFAYRVDFDNVKGHREYDTAIKQGKTCPNLDMGKLKIDVLRMLLRARGMEVSV